VPERGKYAVCIPDVTIMAAVCFRPIATLFVFLLWWSVVALRRLLMHVSWHAFSLTVWVASNR
jgi:hypothetical protein